MRLPSYPFIISESDFFYFSSTSFFSILFLFIVTSTLIIEVKNLKSISLHVPKLRLRLRYLFTIQKSFHAFEVTCLWEES